MKKDRSRVVVERVGSSAARAMQRFKETFPLGPGAGEITTSELRRMVTQAKGEKLAALMEMLGADEVMQAVRDGKV